MSMRTSRVTQVFSGIGLGLARVRARRLRARPRGDAAGHRGGAAGSWIPQGAAGLTPSERAGREIWFKATAGNERFHTYVFQQRLGVLIDWGKVLGSYRPERALRDVGADQRPRLLHARRSELPEEEPRRDLRLRLLPGRRCAARARRQGRAIATRPVISSMPRCRRARPISGTVGMRHEVRHVHRRAGIPQVSQSEVSSRPVARREWARWDPGRRFGKPLADKGADSRAESSARRIDRTAVPDRHVLRRVSHRVQADEASEGSGASAVGEHRRAGRQSVHALVGDPRLRDVAQHARVADLRARAPGDR